MAKEKPAKEFKIFPDDHETKIVFKDEEKSLAELKTIYNIFVEHEHEPIQDLVAELKQVIKDNE